MKWYIKSEHETKASHKQTNTSPVTMPHFQSTRLSPEVLEKQARCVVDLSGHLDDGTDRRLLWKIVAGVEGEGQRLARYHASFEESVDGWSRA